MQTMPKYKSPVSLIPGGSLQLLDFGLPRSALAGVRRFFREEALAGGSAQEPQRYRLHCLQADGEGGFTDMVTGKPDMEDYDVDGRRFLDGWVNQWVPVPVLRLRDQHWPDGGERFEMGPSNWARCRFMHAEDDPGMLWITLAFDMTVEDPPETISGGADVQGGDLLQNGPGTVEGGGSHGDRGVTYALSPRDVSAHGAFRLAPHVRDNGWFLNSAWVDEWLRILWTQRPGSAGKRAQPDEWSLRYLAEYLTFLEVLDRAMQGLVVQVINPVRDNPVNVDLILDIGNSRTTGILVETQAHRPADLGDSYLLQLRDLGNPQKSYADPFETRVEFAEASFGNDALSRRSGRCTPAFVWPSAVRIGPEASRLSTLAVCAEGVTGMSSPKRYLWDERPWQPTWRFNRGGAAEPMVTRGPLAKRVNEEGTPIRCFDDPLFKRNPLLRLQSREVAFFSRYTRSSLMMFMVVEVLMQALLTINSPTQRGRRDQRDVPRRLRQVIFMVPPGMPIAEQRIYRRWVNWAVQLLWDAMGWQDFLLPQGTRMRPGQGGGDYRMSPVVRCDWDEAVCTQLVYLYNELTIKYQGDAHHLFHLLGKVRDGSQDRPCVRMATIDIGGGTTDLSITTFMLESEQSSSARIRPHQDFRDGFNIAGDDILKEVVNSHVLAALGDAVDALGNVGRQSFLSQLFGVARIDKRGELVDNSQENHNRRSQFIRQIATPIALSLLDTYEKTDLLEGSGDFICTFGDFFEAPLEEHSLQEATEAGADAGAHATGSAPEKNTAGNGSAQDTGEEVQDTRSSGITHVLLRHPHPGKAAMLYVEEALDRLAPGEKHSLMDMAIRVQPRRIDATIREVMSRVLSALCEVIQACDCDMLLLTGRPSRWAGIISSIYAKLPVPPTRILPMCTFRAGSWYPFTDPLGKITDPKTTVVVGAILCSLAEGTIAGFSFDTAALAPASTARYIGELDIYGQLKKPKVWFEVDTTNPRSQELQAKVVFTGPLTVGFRSLDVERWPTTRFLLISYAGEEARVAASARLPYTLALKFTRADFDDNSQQDEGELLIESLTDKNGNDVPVRDLTVRLQTLPLDEGYWLDTGVVVRTV